MPDSELTILIKTISEKYGIESVNQELDKLKASTQEAGKGFERHNEHAREAHRIYMKLDQVAPGLGHALHGLFDPAAFKFVATLVALELGVKLLEEWKKKAEDALKRQAELATVTWETQRKISEEARTHWEGIQKQVSDMVANVDHLNDSQQQLSAVMEAQEKQILKTAEGDKLRTAELERQAAVRKQAMLEQIALEDQQALKQADARLQAAQGAAAKGAPGAVEAAQAEGFLKAHTGDVLKKQEQLDIAEKLLANFTAKGMGGFVDETAAAIFRKKVAEATEALEAAKNAQIANERLVDAHNRAVKKLTDEEDRAAEEVKKRYGQMVGAQTEAQRNAAVIGASELGRVSADLFNANLPNVKATRTLLSGVEAAEAAAHGDRLTGEQDKTMVAIRTALIRGGATQEQINALIKEMLDITVSQDRKIRDLYQQIYHVKLQVKSSVN